MLDFLQEWLSGPGALVIVPMGIFGILGPLIGGGLSLFGAIRGAKQEAQQSRLAEQAARLAQQDFASRVPLRRTALDLLTTQFPTTRPDLGAVFAGTGNPFAIPFTTAPPALPPAAAPPTRPVRRRVGPPRRRRAGGGGGGGREDENGGPRPPFRLLR